MILQQLLALDQNILLWIQDNLRTDFLTPLLIFITRLGDHGQFWIVLSLVLLIPKKTRRAGFLSLCALTGSLLINNFLLKNLVGRIRPYEVIQGLQLLIEKQKDLSFPSGHTGSSFSSAIVLLACLPRKYGIPAVILAVLIGFSRLYVGVHYPTDVLFGALTGTAIAVCVCLVHKKICEKKEEKQRNTEEK